MFFISVNVTVTNAQIQGLRNFQLRNVISSIFTGRLFLDVLYPELKIDGQHNTTGSAGGSTFVGSGPFNIVATSEYLIVTIDTLKITNN